MITSWDIYWITRLDSINGLAVVIGILSLVTIWALAMCGSITNDAILKYKKSIIASLFTGVIFFVASLFIPTTKEFAVIYLAPKVINNEQVQKVPDNALKLLNKKMEEWVNDIDKKKEK